MARNEAEARLQRAIINRVNAMAVVDKRWRYIYHVPNGGARDKATGALMKALGVRRGVPDLQWDIARHGFHGLRLELKADRNDATPEQSDWLQNLANEGYCCAVVHNNVDDAMSILEWYINGEELDYESWKQRQALLSTL
jgi:hypothetical protein